MMYSVVKSRIAAGRLSAQRLLLLLFFFHMQEVGERVVCLCVVIFWHGIPKCAFL